MNTEIKQIMPHELDKACEILSSVVAHMKKIGFTQWDEGYPRRDILEKDIQKSELYGAYINGTLAGFAVINSAQDKQYESIRWQYGILYLVVHRLQIDPTFRGQGIAYDLMIYAEKLAKEQGAKAIRLDTRHDNTPAIKLYEKLGYKKRGIVHFPRMPEEDFICFEKRIIKIN
jgi:ribosomal protein S18 acetylase RimI-like enzyme